MGHKAVIVRRLAELDGLIADFLTGRGEAERIKLEQLRRSLLDKLEVINGGLTDDAEELTADLLEAEEFSHQIHEALIKFEKHLMTRFTPVSTEPTGPAAAIPSHSTRTRLPELSVKPFSGELTE